MNIPILDLKAQYDAIRDEVNAKVLGVLASQSFVLGAEVEALEDEIAAYSGVKFAVGVSSGSDALLISLMALGVGPGCAVVTTPFTFFATAGSIARLGARPVFCDIDERTFNIDPECAEAALQREKRAGRLGRVKAVLPVHLYGQCADMTPLIGLAKRHGLWLVEDAAQAIGSEYRTPKGIRRAGAMGTMGALSFYPSKNLGGYGDGGMVLTDSRRLADRLRLLRVHGGARKYHHKLVGGNFRLDALQAAVLRVKLPHLEDWQRKRRERAAYYDLKIAETGLAEAGLVTTPAAVHKDGSMENYHTYHQYVIRAKSRNHLHDFLRKKGIGTSVFYPLSLHEQECFSYLGYKQGDFPASERAAREVLALPMFPELTAEQQDHIVAAVREFYD